MQKFGENSENSDKIALEEAFLGSYHTPPAPIMPPSAGFDWPSQYRSVTLHPTGGDVERAVGGEPLALQPQQQQGGAPKPRGGDRRCYAPGRPGSGRACRGEEPEERARGDLTVSMTGARGGGGVRYGQFLNVMSMMIYNFLSTT